MQAFLVILVFCFCTPSHLWAQETDGSFLGIVTSGNGIAIANANIIVTGPGVQGSRGTSSDEHGAFHLSRLPVGKYRLEISSVGFSTVVFENLNVTLGTRFNLGTIVLSEKTTELSEVVISENRIYLASSTETGGVISKQTMDAIPVDRDFKSVITLLPSVNASYYGDQPNIGGATGSENMFFVDGINVTDNYDVSTSMSIPYNFIKEIQVKQGGYDARFGRTYGGLINAVTESGTNEFHVNAFSFYTSSGLGQEPKTDGAPGSTVRNYRNYDAGFSFGGPLVKDKLWYFVAFNHLRKQNEREVVGHGFFADQRTTNMFAGKLTWQLSHSTNLSFSILGDPTVHDQVLNTDIGSIVPTEVINPDALLPRFQTGGLYSIISGNSVTANKWQFDYSVFGYSRRLIEKGQTAQGSNQPQLTDFSDPTKIVLSGGIGVEQNSRMWKYGGQGAVSKQIGLSTFSAGFSLEVNGANIFQSYDGANTGFINLLDTSPTYITGNFFFIPEIATTINPSFFLQNVFRASSHFEIFTGLRWDGWKLTSKGNNLQDMHLLQPRFGLNYFAGDEGKHKLFASYSLLYQQLPLYAAIGYFTHTERVDIYDQDPRLPGAIALDSIYFTPADKPDFEKVTSLKPDYLSEFSFGYETAMTRSLRLSFKGIYRALGNAFLTGFTQSENFIAGNAGEGKLSFLPPVAREYIGMELQLRGSALADRIYLNASYLLSSNYGNFTGYFDQDQRGTSLPGGNSGYTVEEQAVNSTGYMPNDRRHIAKAFVSYSFKFGLTAGASATFMTGTPLNEIKPDSTTVYGFRFAFVSPRGTAGRLPNIWDVSFRLTYSNDKFPGKIYLDLFHVGSKQTVVFQNQMKYTDAAGQSPNPNFGKPLAYLPPMFLRLGVEFKL